MSIRRLLKHNKGFKIPLGSLKAIFYKSLTEFYQISLIILRNLTDFSSQLMACMQDQNYLYGLCKQNHFSWPYCCLLHHIAVCDVCLWMLSLQTYEHSKSRDTDNRRGVEDVRKAILYLFADGSKRRFLVVAYEHVTKRVANVKNGIYKQEK